MLRIEELNKIVEDTINVYKNSEEYARKRLLNIDENTIILLDNNEVYEKEGILSIEFIVKNGVEKKPIIHINTDYLRVKEYNTEDYSYNFTIKSNYNLSLDKIGDKWNQDKQADGKVYGLNILISLLDKIKLNCILNDLISMEHTIYTPISFLKYLDRNKYKFINCTFSVTGKVILRCDRLLEFEKNFECSKILHMEKVEFLVRCIGDMYPYGEFLKTPFFDFDNLIVLLDFSSKYYETKYIEEIKQLLINHLGSLSEETKKYIIDNGIKLDVKCKGSESKEKMYYMVKRLEETYGEIYDLSLLREFYT